MAAERPGPRGPEQLAIVDVTGWTASHQEDMGSKAKVWLLSPEEKSWLFKYVRRDDEQAEDWPEKVAAELAVVLGIPAATVELADRGGQRGVISSAYDVFVSYLVFDALIANQDRHHENWAVLTGGERPALSPSFDHASSLGFMLTDADRRARLTTRDRGYSVRNWAARGQGRFEGRPTLVELARAALLRCSPQVRVAWIERVRRRLTTEVWDTILRRVPESRLSDPARTFASEVLTINRGRLLDACDALGD